MRNAVRAHLATGWTLAPLIYQNEATEPPVESDGVLRPWVYIEITHNANMQWSIGEEPRTGNRWREEGIVFFHLFTPSGAGIDTSDLYADTMIALFRGLELDPSLEFRDFSSDIGGKSEDGNYYRVSIAVEWVLN